MESREIARLKRNLTYENLWMYILKTLKDGEKHAYALQAEINSRYGFLPGRITIYKVLYLLQKHNFVSSHKGKENGRERRYYNLTSRAATELSKAVAVMKEISGKVGP